MSDDAVAGGGDQFLGKSDWGEQDLLTIDEASERLEEEIAELRAMLEHQIGAAREKTASRLLLMERVLHSLLQGPSPLASTTPSH
jgi:hypothetical protein